MRAVQNANIWFKLDSVLPNEGNERDAAMLKEKRTFWCKGYFRCTDIMIGKDFDLAVTF